MRDLLNSTSLGAAVVQAVRRHRAYSLQSGVSAKFLRRFWKLRHFLLSLITSSDVDPHATLGEGVMLPHPNGIVIHADAIIGDDCMIMQQVTIGQLSDGAVPVVGCGVYIGAGAKILGLVTIGDGARIGANAVVLADVPAGWTAVGVPARLLAPAEQRPTGNVLQSPG